MKNVLMIAPQFYGYETAIINHLEKIGYNVVFVNPNIDEINIPLKIIYKYIKRFNFLIDKLYYALKVKNVRNQVDEVFVIYTHYITESIMEKIKKEYSLCRYILYFWDSVDNNPTSLLLTKYFDKILTFDPRDSKKYGWIYRPYFI